MAARLDAELRAAMRAAIDEDADLTVLIAHHDNGILTDIGLDEIAALRNFRGQADIVPRASAKNALLLARVDPGSV